jgi:hypothetical protein
MLTDICKELNNWFDTHRLFGKFAVADGEITDDEFLSRIQPEQYFRIVGSVFNDGVYQFTDELSLHDEVFDGAVWLMAVPPSVIELADEIKSWNDKYGGVDSENMSPYNSESFGGYSYSKSGGGSSDDGKGGTWQSVFGNRLKQYRKVHPF